MRFKLPAILSDGMVIQRGKAVPIYGNDHPGQKIVVRVLESSFETVTNSDGSWQVTLSEQEACGPILMEVTGSESVILSDIWFGDVYLLAGQSNMELPLSRVMTLYKKEIAHALVHEQEVIRQFTLAKEGCFNPRQAMDLNGQWHKLSLSGLEEISAVGWFFARAYQKKGKVAVALIQAAVGGSPMEAWCHEGLLLEWKPQIMDRLAELRQAGYKDKVIQEDTLAGNRWFEEMIEEDGRHELTRGCDRDWREASTIDLPAMFADTRDLSGHRGLIWLRKEFHLQDHQVRDMTLKLGTIIDRDDVWINGEWVGQTTYQYPPRVYSIRRQLLHEGLNTIVIRVIVDQGCGGFHRGKPYHLITEDRQQRINLRGQWQYLLGDKRKNAPSVTFFNMQPSALYNGMLYPLKKTVIKGVLWYQGESNVLQEAHEKVYEPLFQGFVMELRRLFGNSRLPLVGALLAGYDVDRSKRPGPTADFRQVQLEAMTGPGVGIISAADLGEYNDIHPLRKKPLGQRYEKAIGVLLKHESYHYPGPKLSELREVSEGWLLTFECLEGPLVISKPSSFQLEVQSEDKQEASYWLTAYGEAMASNSLLIRRPDQGKKTLAIGYGHLDWPSQMGLYDTQGMPVMPFVVEVEKKNDD